MDHTYKKEMPCGNFDIRRFIASSGDRNFRGNIMAVWYGKYDKIWLHRFIQGNPMYVIIDYHYEFHEYNLPFAIIMSEII